MKIFSRDIRISTFFKKGLPRMDDRYALYCVTGKQGSGKSFFAIYLASRQDKNIVNYIKTNIHSLKIPGYKIEYFTKINEIINDTDEHVIYIIDEISRKYDKNSRTDTQFYAWLNQCRKRKRIAILITQEYKEMPMWLRRPIKYMITTRPTMFCRFTGIYVSTVGDGYNLIFNKDEGEYECPTIQYIYYKRNQSIANYYDTFEPINDL